MAILNKLRALFPQFIEKSLEKCSRYARRLRGAQVLPDDTPQKGVAERNYWVAHVPIQTSQRYIGFAFGVYIVLAMTV